MIFRNCPKYYSFVRRCSKAAAVMEQQPLLSVDKIVKLNLPSYPKSSVNLHYYDSSPMSDTNAERQRIVMGTHGSPGTHNDFKYMVPSLISAGFRVIIPNWPGFGITENPPDNMFSHSNLERSQLLSSFVKAIDVKRIDVVFGHSSGCWPLPPFLVNNPDLCSAAVFIAPGCATPHKALRPYWLTQFLASLLNTWLKPLVSYFLYFAVTKLFDMKVAHRDHSAVATRIVANVDFPNFPKFLSTLKESKKPPIVLVCAGSDHLIETERSFEYAEKLGCSESDGSINRIENSAEIKTVISKALSPGGRLSRHHMIMYNRGNHFIQKHEAAGICDLIKAIVESNKALEFKST